VEIFCDGQLIKTWPRAGRGRHTDPADYPPEKIAFFLRTPVWCRSRAEALGEHVTELVVGLLADHALHLWVPRTLSPHATCTYSWRRPPSGSRRSTWVAAPEGRGVSPTGGR
jgi:hypothetical protein